MPLDSSVPDCNVWHRNPARHRTIEITIVQGLERLYLMTELNETGHGRGFLGLTDDQSKVEFLSAMNNDRRMYSTEEAQTTMLHAISLCVRKKVHSSGDTLLIEAPLHWLQRTRWLQIQSLLMQLVEELSFTEVYLIGSRDDDGDHSCLQLK
jgi:hypothetical protein